MYKKVLVVYDTKSGSTAEVAGLIGDTLLDSGAQVAVEPVASARKVDDYDAVIIGNPIISGKCMPGIKEFVRTNHVYLCEKPVAFFITCLRMGQEEADEISDIPLFIDPALGTPKPRSKMTFLEKSHLVTSYMKEISSMAVDIQPISISFFKGVLDYSTIGFFWTWFFKLTGKMDGLKPGDYRNWEAIRSWAAIG